jgi:tight adherence protein C
VHQLGCLVLGAVTGAVAGLVVAQTRPLSPILLLALPIVTGAAAVVVRDQLLARAARSRVQRMTSELPTVLEFLSLSLSAGEGILDSLRRVARAGAGELPRELGGVVAAVASGLPLSAALDTLSRELAMAPLTRAIDQVIGALERGSPLVEVLRAQAQDCRDEAKRDLLEMAGRKEVTMLVPLVFLILPTTVLIAIFPGILVLQTGF